MFDKKWIVLVCCAVSVSTFAASDQPPTAPQSPASIKKQKAVKKEQVVRPARSIQEVFYKSKDEIYKPYREKLKTNPVLKGYLGFRITIAQNGTVVQSDIIESTLKDQEVENRVNKTISGLKFGKIKQPGNTTIWYALTFAPEYFKQK